jgi:hypothetical protein
MNKDIPKFPDLPPPDSIVESQFYVIENEDIQSRKNLRKLINLMYKHQEAAFYLFSMYGTSLNHFVSEAEEKNIIVLPICEPYYYRDPKYERNYIKVKKDQTEWDGEKQVADSSPMFNRITLKLSDHQIRIMNRRRGRAALYFWISLIIAFILFGLSLYFSSPYEIKP